MKSEVYSVFLGVDRSDAWLDLTVDDPDGHQLDQLQLPRSPVAWKRWLLALHKKYPKGKIAVCFEQPAANLIAFFSEFAFVDVFAINPTTLNAYRKAFVSSGAKDDDTDSEWLAKLLRQYYGELRRWSSQDPTTRKLQTLVKLRRGVVDERTRLNNQLLEHLKSYQPEVLELLGETIYSRLSINFLRRWPHFAAAQSASDAELLDFYRHHRCVRQTALDRRLKHVREACSLTSDPSILEPAALKLNLYLNQFEVLADALERMDQQIQACMCTHEDAPLFTALPGSGCVYAARLLSAFGSDREKWESADDLLNFSGIAPITKRSGKSKIVRRRIACPRFIKQSFHEYAAQSIRHCKWARAYYLRMKEKGKKHHHCVRALAYKWIRIMFACWKSRTAYDDSKYMQVLERKNHQLYELARQTILPACAKKT